MRGREVLVLAGAAACSLVVMGWIIWSERPAPAPEPVAARQAGASSLADSRAEGDGAEGQAPADSQAVPGLGAGAVPEEGEVDAARVAVLEADAAAEPGAAAPRRALGDLYFEARRFSAAIPWYEEVLELEPGHAEAGTSLGVSYFYDGQPQRAVEAFERVLAAHPAHPRALLSLGIVKAFGLQDLAGARAAWEQLIAAAPDSAESGAARAAIERLGAAHGGLDAAAP